MQPINQIRQGDVLLVRRPAPKHSTRKHSLSGLHVPGERTGHAHTLPAEVYDTEHGRLLYLPNGDTMTHDEHAPAEVPAGWWEPILQREFAPSRRPADRFHYD